MSNTEDHKDSKFDFVYDLQKEIPRWVTHGLIDSEQSKNILEYYLWYFSFAQYSHRCK